MANITKNHKPKKVLMKDIKESANNIDKSFLKKDYKEFRPSKEALKRLKEDRFLDSFIGRCPI